MEKKLLFIGALVALAICISGCGHNSVVYSDGVGLETTLNPETFTFGLNFRYGKILTATVKEKTEVKLESGFSQGSDIADGKSLGSKTSLDAKLSLITGDQVTGYVVELEKAKQASK